MVNEIKINYNSIIQREKHTEATYQLKIQELACSLLLEYFTWPLDGSPGPSGDGFDGSTECHLLTKALQLSNSPKPYQCQSGALLCKLVFSK